LKANIITTLKELGGSANESLLTLVKQYAPNGNPNSIKDEAKLLELQSKLAELKKPETK
jgi:hypothetical protein